MRVSKKRNLLKTSLQPKICIPISKPECQRDSQQDFIRPYFTGTKQLFSSPELFMERNTVFCQSEKKNLKNWSQENRKNGKLHPQMVNDLQAYKQLARGSDAGVCYCSFNNRWYYQLSLELVFLWDVKYGMLRKYFII